MWEEILGTRKTERLMSTHGSEVVRFMQDAPTSLGKPVRSEDGTRSREVGHAREKESSGVARMGFESGMEEVFDRTGQMRWPSSDRNEMGECRGSVSEGDGEWRGNKRRRSVLHRLSARLLDLSPLLKALDTLQHIVQ